MISGKIVYQELLMPLEDKLPSLIEGGGFNRVVERGFAVFMGYVGWYTSVVFDSEHAADPTTWRMQ